MKKKYSNLQDLVTLAKFKDTDESFCPVTWWKRNSEQLPGWAAAFRKVLLVQPSSAAASECVFSLLNAFFNDQQDHSIIARLH